MMSWLRIPSFSVNIVLHKDIAVTVNNIAVDLTILTSSLDKWSNVIVLNTLIDSLYDQTTYYYTVC